MNPEALIENLNNSVIVVDRDQVVLRVNVAAETLFSKSRRYLLGHPLAEVVPVDKITSYIDQCFSDNAHFTLREVALEIGGAESLVDLTMQCVIGEAQINTVVLIEINSISRISRFMREKNQVERQQSFRLMMRGLAHEIKNPLGGIRGAAQLLDREITDPSRRQLTGILIKEADRLTRLVDRVMGSREQLKPCLLNIHEVLEHVIRLVSVKSDSELTIHRNYDPALPEINVDREQMIQATLNIVGNAIEAQQGRDQIVIGINTEFDRFVTINRETYRQALNIKIWDEGTGVVSELQDILFDPLITSRPEGTGLGLSITQEIVQRHKGLVQLEEYEGKTCFTISLPYLSTKLDAVEDLSGGLSE
ncbi:MAG: nitrogen regulation protein NR(II) [Arenicella sp.]|jgi:two-component system nitrogen regulation sensor histidine kinase GlnL|nr:nitrogen regulation protein NR(II) [Arenicella sp.]